MAEMMLRREVTRVPWGPVVAGAFLAVAISIVLGLFGAAFTVGGLTDLCGIWEILTPLVATFCGAALAAVIARQTEASLTGVMVWCVALTYGAALLIGMSAFGATPQHLPAGGAALAGLAAILGLLGGLAGASFGTARGRQAARASESRLSEGDRGARTVYERDTVTGTPRVPPGEPPGIRH